MRRFILIILTGVLFCQGLSGAEWKAGFSQWRMEQALDALEEFAGEIEDIREINGNMYYAALCKRINSYGREIIPLMLRDVEDKGKDWKYRYMLLQRCIFVNGKTRQDAKDIIDVFINVIKDKGEKEEIKEWACDGLSLIGIQSEEIMGVKRPEAEWYRLQTPEEREGIVEALISIIKDKGESKGVRWRAIRALSTFSDQADRIIPILKDCLNEASKDIRAIAITTLWGIGMTAEKERIGAILVDRLQVEQDDLVKEQIIYGIKTLKVREAIPLLMESLRDGRYCSRAQAAELLGIMKVKEAVPLLIEGLEDSSLDFIREKAAFALGEIRDKRAVKPLCDVLLNDKTGAYLDAARALGKIGDKRAIQPLMKRFSKSSFHPWFVEALIRLDAREAIPLIEEKMPKGKKLYGSEAEIKDKFERFKRGEKIDWEEK